MVQPTPLYYVNGGTPTVPSCANCGVTLADDRDRCSARGSFFCRADPEHPEDSCLMQWRRRQH